MENQIPRIWSLLERTPWAIQPEKLEQIIEVLKLRATGQELDYAAAKTPQSQDNTNGVVAVVPVFGMISHRTNLVSNFSGGTSAEILSKTLRSLADNPEVRSIVLDINSPGGEVFGVPELAKEIRDIRGQKRVVALANPIAASAAYWIASSANAIYSIPSGQVGSIGVYGVHKDISQAEDKLGVKVTLISAGKYKAEGSEHAPLTDEARAYMQEQVDAYYGMFLDGVAAGRRIDANAVESKYGEGRMVMAEPALESGMIDGITSLDSLIKRELKISQGGISAEIADIKLAAAAALPCSANLTTDEERLRRLRMA